MLPTISLTDLPRELITCCAKAVIKHPEAAETEKVLKTARAISALARTCKECYQACEPPMIKVRLSFQLCGHYHILRAIDIADDHPRAQDYRKSVNQMIDALGGRARFLQCPILDIGEKEGATGYIDFITEEAFIGKNSPILVGMDKSKRLFFCMFLSYKTSGHMRPSEFVLTCFQRGTQSSMWCCSPGPGRAISPIPTVFEPQDITLFLDGKNPKGCVLGDVAAFNAHHRRQ